MSLYDHKRGYSRAVAVKTYLVDVVALQFLSQRHRLDYKPNPLANVPPRADTQMGENQYLVIIQLDEYGGVDS